MVRIPYNAPMKTLLLWLGTCAFFGGFYCVGIAAVKHREANAAFQQVVERFERIKAGHERRLKEGETLTHTPQGWYVNHTDDRPGIDITSSVSAIELNTAQQQVNEATTARNLATLKTFDLALAGLVALIAGLVTTIVGLRMRPRDQVVAAEN